METCIDCKPETIEEILSSSGIALKKEITIGYKFVLNNRTYTVKRIQGSQAKCQYNTCSCSGSWFKLDSIP
jgi:hypothetical protein